MNRIHISIISFECRHVLHRRIQIRMQIDLFKLKRSAAFTSSLADLCVAKSRSSKKTRRSSWRGDLVTGRKIPLWLSILKTLEMTSRRWRSRILVCLMMISGVNLDGRRSFWGGLQSSGCSLWRIRLVRRGSWRLHGMPFVNWYWILRWSFNGWFWFRTVIHARFLSDFAALLHSQGNGLVKVTTWIWYACRGCQVVIDCLVRCCFL